ncbi:MAG: penicillin-binding protein 2 [Nocardioides sp.]|nr:penicillin-binding protein 2 [Nocardioides sp.]
MPARRLRIGFLLIAVVLSAFGARLVQLQGVDPGSYAALAAAEGTVNVVLPAARGDIVDRDGQPLADSVDGLMVVANPQVTVARAPELAKFLAAELDVDYFPTLTKLRDRSRQFEYIARRVPSTQATDVIAGAEELGFQGLSTRRDPLRDYPAGDIAANLVGFVGTDQAYGGLEEVFDTSLSGRDGSTTYEVGAGNNRIPLGSNSTTPAVDGADLLTTIDRDLQWYTQRVLRQAVQGSGAESGLAVIMDSRTGEILSLADDPTFDANTPADSPNVDRGSRALSLAYEPGSVEKVLTVAGLVDAGKVTSRTRLTVPGRLDRQDRTINDYWEHGTINLTMAGVIAKSSNIGTVLAADRFAPGQLRTYLREFGLGERSNIGIPSESRGILPAGEGWTSQAEDRIAFGQSLSVNGIQMAAAVNTIANGGLRVDPSLVQGSATTDDGVAVGTDTTTTRRVVSENAARQTAQMMERVVDPEVGVAPRAAVPGYRVAGKTGTAQRVGAECGCYDGTNTVSFGGFAPANEPRFTIYVAIQAPTNGGGGGSVAGPVFSQLMSYTLQRYGVAPTGTTPSMLPVTW